jgi:tetratricopeptide (TPR) repeat protein
VWGEQAAEALEHAHGLGIVHRDVKPANLLVDGRGNLWVTDFGLARTVSDAGLTLSGDILGTLRYMSPEQALARHGVVDHRTDLYALGATLYELLTGRPAVEGQDRQDIMNRIAGEEPRAPRTLNRAMPADLETIVLKALAKEPAERYATARELAVDLRRFLDNRPIQARRAGLMQRGARWVRRHKSIVVAGVGTGLVLVVLLVTGLLWHNRQLWTAAEREHTQAEEIRRERDSAEEERRWARRAVDDMYTQVAERWLQGRPRLQPVQCEFLEKALQFYGRAADQAGDDPEVRTGVASASYRLGKIQLALARHGEAQESFRRAAGLFEGLAVEFPDKAAYRRDLGCCWQGLGQAHQATGHSREAADSYRQAADHMRRLAREFPDRPEYQSLLGGVQEGLAMVLAETAKAAEAEQTYGEARDGLRALVKAFPDRPEYRIQLAGVASNLGNLLAKTGRPERAEVSYREALSGLEKLSAEFPREPDYRERWAYNLANLGSVLTRGRRLAEAELVLRQGAGLLEKLAAESPDVPDYQWELGCALDNLVLVLKYQDRLPQAEACSAHAVGALQRLAARFPAVPNYRKDLGQAESNRGRLLARMNRPEEAEAAYRRAAAVQGKLVGEFPGIPSHREELAKTYSSLVALLRGCGRLPEAETVQAEALRLREKSNPPAKEVAPRND